MDLTDQLQALHAFLVASGWPALPLAAALAFGTGFMLPLPGCVLATACAALFGLPLGVLCAWLPACAGAACSFLLARRLGRGFVERFVPTDRLARMDRAAARHGLAGVFIARAMPCVPFGMASLACGLSGMGFGAYMAGTMAGKFVPTLAYALLGEAAFSLSWQDQPLLPAGAAATAAAFLLLTRVRRKGGPSEE
ncbi:MAG: TVP38/TMEM64 family protein [Desulfovibrio sp.]|nr:TVP38/TMEM64 family protein [Desulfovibrio sp.]